MHAPQQMHESAYAPRQHSQNEDVLAANDAHALAAFSVPPSIQIASVCSASATLADFEVRTCCPLPGLFRIAQRRDASNGRPVGPRARVLSVDRSIPEIASSCRVVAPLDLCRSCWAWVTIMLFLSNSETLSGLQAAVYLLRRWCPPAPCCSWPGLCAHGERRGTLKTRSDIYLLRV